MAENLLWKADLGNGKYRNPILFTDYSDPDVIRVEDTFYMTASSFNCVPGLPILVSKDLVNWEIKNYAVKELPFDTYNQPAYGKGIWAPSIRYHNNMFWIFVGMPDEGIFMTSTKDPLGEWSSLTCVWSGKGFIDPCPFWDDDGKAYIIHGYAKSRIGFNSKLGIFPMSMDGTICLGEDIIIFDGTITQPTIEGPKVYKREGYYYIFAPAGGVEDGWQTVLRSTHILGPYEEKIVMHQGSTNINGPHQGGLVDTPSHEEWFIHFQDKGVYGRIVHLQPVTWENHWPIIGVNPNEEGVGEPVLKYRKPSGCPDVMPTEPESSDYFSNGRLGLSWQWIGNVKEGFYSTSERPGHLRLFPINPTKKPNEILWNCANILTQKIPVPEFIMEVKMDVFGLEEGQKTGVIALGGKYAYLGIKKIKEELYLQYVMSKVIDGVLQEEVQWEKHLNVKDNEKIVWLQIQFYDTGECKFSISLDGEEDEVVTEYFSPEKAMWVGAKVGIFAIDEEVPGAKGYVDIEYVEFKK
ncbi:glycoside hydrolase family 43 protein [Natranaerovirga pectinivora]|nr:glycoside hydrolase 43 family protein [Natranaerovirga pectinivora]